MNTLASQFRYLSPPTINGLSPPQGPAWGDTQVTIAGSGLTGATTVMFGANPATNVWVINDSQIIANSPAGIGQVEVQVTNPAGSSAATIGSQFAYLSAPTVAGLSTVQGPAAGGTRVTINGSGLTGATAVMFGSNPATNVTVINDSQITADSPAGTGQVSVQVINPVGTSGQTPQFTYLPWVEEVSTNAGSESGNTLVKITGAGLTAATGVVFGNVTVLPIHRSSDTEILVATPAGTGTVNIQLSTSAGPSQTGFQFTYVSTPTISGLSEEEVNGTTWVSVAGTGFTSGSGVRFGKIVVTNFQVASPTLIVAEMPRGKAHTRVHVRVITPTGESTITKESEFTYP
jgi:hypothetical protein